MTIQTSDRLWLSCLSPEQHERTCGYWYTLTSRQSPFTAFRTRAALEFFFETHRLKLHEPLPFRIGVHASIKVEGSCRFAMHGDLSQMPSEGKRILKLSNAKYTLGLVTEDEAGTIVHFVGPNGMRPIFDPAMSRAHEDAGHKGPLEALIAQV